ncbi:MAG: hypothetical protein ABSG35_10915 [Syntrophobacteraceae bacterium]
MSYIDTMSDEGIIEVVEEFFGEKIPEFISRRSRDLAIDELKKSMSRIYGIMHGGDYVTELSVV